MQIKKSVRVKISFRLGVTWSVCVCVCACARALIKLFTFPLGSSSQLTASVWRCSPALPTFRQRNHLLKTPPRRHQQRPLRRRRTGNGLAAALRRTGRRAGRLSRDFFPLDQRFWQRKERRLRRRLRRRRRGGGRRRRRGALLGHAGRLRRLPADEKVQLQVVCFARPFYYHRRSHP